VPNRDGTQELLPSWNTERQDYGLQDYETTGLRDDETTDYKTTGPRDRKEHSAAEPQPGNHWGLCSGLSLCMIPSRHDSVCFAL